MAIDAHLVMAEKNPTQDEAEELEYRQLVEQESLILTTTSALYELMEETGVSKSELARRIGKTRAYITQLLNGSRNMTLRTVSDLAFAMGYRFHVTAQPLHFSYREAPLVVTRHLVDQVEKDMAWCRARDGRRFRSYAESLRTTRESDSGTERMPSTEVSAA